MNYFQYKVKTLCDRCLFDCLFCTEGATLTLANIDDEEEEMVVVEMEPPKRKNIATLTVRITTLRSQGEINKVDNIAVEILFLLLVCVENSRTTCKPQYICAAVVRWGVGGSVPSVSGLAAGAASVQRSSSGRRSGGGARGAGHGQV